MLKCYFSRECTPQPTPAVLVVSVCAAPPQDHPSDDALTEKKWFTASCVRNKKTSTESFGVFLVSSV